MKSIYIATFIGLALVTGAVMLSRSEKVSDTNQRETVSIENGKQVVTITAKGGYSPNLTNAKANIPTVLRMETQGTFDCSSTLNIPALSYQKNLPPTGITEIEIPPQKSGTLFKGLCGMGMYTFEIAFK